MVDIPRYNSNITAVLLGGRVRGCVEGGLGEVFFFAGFCFLLLYLLRKP